MAKLSLTANPTFKASVGIPIPGGDPQPVLFTFRHKTGTALAEWQEAAKDMTNAAAIFSIAEAWDLDDDFTGVNIARLCDQYIGAAGAIFNVYVRELRGARAKN